MIECHYSFSISDIPFVIHHNVILIWLMSFEVHVDIHQRKVCLNSLPWIGKINVLLWTIKVMISLNVTESTMPKTQLFAQANWLNKKLPHSQKSCIVKIAAYEYMAGRWTLCILLVLYRPVKCIYWSIYCL